MFLIEMDTTVKVIVIILTSMVALGIFYYIFRFGLSVLTGATGILFIILFVITLPFRVVIKIFQLIFKGIKIIFHLPEKEPMTKTEKRQEKILYKLLQSDADRYLYTEDYKKRVEAAKATKGKKINNQKDQPSVSVNNSVNPEIIDATNETQNIQVQQYPIKQASPEPLAIISHYKINIKRLMTFIEMWQTNPNPYYREYDFFILNHGESIGETNYSIIKEFLLNAEIEDQEDKINESNSVKY